MEKVKFVSVTRTICPKTQLHYLDAISDDGEYYTAVMSPQQRGLVGLYFPVEKGRTDAL